MRILLYRSDGQTGAWAEDLARAMPGVETVGWQEGDTLGDCDYAVLWNPSAGLLAQLDKVKAVFLMGAGADALLKFGDALPAVPIVRLGDAGMAVQMAEYVSYATLRYFRRFDEYEEQARHGLWAPLPAHVKEDFTVGVMGLGKLGLRVVETLRGFGFPVRGWSRTAKDIAGVAYVGHHAAGAGGGDVRTLALDIRGRLRDRPAVVVVIGDAGDKPAAVVALNEAAQERGLSANQLIGVVGDMIGGRGGGKADVAQGGGTDVSAIPAALAAVEAALSA